MEFESSKPAIAQIHSFGSEAIVGTGFLVAKQYLLTCAHVVKEALSSPEQAVGEALSVTFYGTMTPRQAEVVFFSLDEQIYGSDVAVLYLPEATPPEVKPVPLSCLQQFNDLELRVFGFPNNDSAGRNLIAVTRGEVSGGWVQTVNAEALGMTIEAGLSGSPVWCDAERGVVGMVVARHWGRDSEDVGFILPVQKLQAARLEIQQHSLLKLLSPVQETLPEQLTTAYTVCRPPAWPGPFEQDLERRLADMAKMSPAKLVEFAACLLRQSGADSLQADLVAWIGLYKSDDTGLASLLRHAEERLRQVAPQRTTIFNPCLLIRLQADKMTKKEPYQIDAWLVPNSGRYNPETREGYNSATGEGAEPLTSMNWQKYVENPDSIDVTQGIRYEYLPAFLADYLDQVARRGISSEDLTVEFFLPLPLMNQAIEQCHIPVEFGLPAPLGIAETCPHVVIRSQERLDFARGLKRWEDKWNRLQNELQTAAAAVFIDGDELSSKELQSTLMTALGLKWTKKLPAATNRGEIGILLATGTPVAVWIRRQEAPHLTDDLNTEVLSSCLEHVPEKVKTLRRNTAALDEDVPPEFSLKLGHHLSFLWEDFHRVPPSIVYSDAKL